MKDLDDFLNGESNENSEVIRCVCVIVVLMVKIYLVFMGAVWSVV